jgi:hypothetical protein
MSVTLKSFKKCPPLFSSCRDSVLYFTDFSFGRITMTFRAICATSLSCPADFLSSQCDLLLCCSCGTLLLASLMQSPDRTDYGACAQKLRKLSSSATGHQTDRLFRNSLPVISNDLSQQRDSSRRVL